jgi:hypothetical protein
MSLSTLIVQREIASIREVEEALARQVLYGGDFVTNLLEIGTPDERALLDVVCESLGMLAAPSGVLPKAPEAAAQLVYAELALRRNLTPLATGKDGLVLAVSEPLSGDVEQELAFALAMPIVQRIAFFVRIKQAHERDYKVPLERRIQRLAERLDSGARSRSSSLPPRETDRRLAAPRPPSIAPSASDAPQARQTAPPPPAFLAERTLVRAERAPSSRAPSARRRGAITTEAVQRELDQAVNRDVILDLLFDFSRQYFDYTAMFLVHGHTAEGHDAFGNGANRETVCRIGVPLDAQSVFSVPLVGAPSARLVTPSADGIDAILMNDLGCGGTLVCVVPVIVRGRVVAWILGDGGSAGVEETTLATVDAMAAYASSAFERLIVRRKLGGGASSALGASLLPGRFSSSPERPDRVSRVPAVVDSMQPQTPDQKTIESVRTVTQVPPSVVAVAPEPTPLSAAPLPTPSKRKGRSAAPALEFGMGAESPLLGLGAFYTNVVPMQRPVSDDEAAPSSMPNSSELLSADDSDVTVVEEETAPAARRTNPDDEVTQPGPKEDDETHPVALLRPPMPASAQQVSVAAHRPPSSRNTHSGPLPSVIVDITSEYERLVERVIERPSDPALPSTEDAEGELLHAGRAAMPTIMAAFPGPVTISSEALLEGHLPRVGECGPVLRLIARQRSTALPFVIARIDDADVEVRFWTTYLLTELVYPEALEPLLRRLFDDDTRIRRVAGLAARAFSASLSSKLVERLATIANDSTQARERRLLALLALTAARDGGAIPSIVPCIEDADEQVVQTASTTLSVLARQDFGHSAAAWTEWWELHGKRHRLEWLIDALVHEESAVRTAAGDELKATTKEFFGYYPDLPRRERERAQTRYREWWNNVGCVRFSRSTRR